VGVIANLAAWFAIHVIFAAVGDARLGPVRLYVPDWTTLDWRAALLTVLACGLVLLSKWSVVRVLVISAVGGLILSAL